MRLLQWGGMPPERRPERTAYQVEQHRVFLAAPRRSVLTRSRIVAQLNAIPVLTSDEMREHCFLAYLMGEDA